MADPSGTNSRNFVAYAAVTNMVRGTGTATNTNPTAIIPPGGPGTALYITSMQFSNTSATTVTASINDGTGSVFIVPAGGGSNISCVTPLVVASNATLTFTLSTGVSSVIANAQGYYQ